MGKMNIRGSEYPIKKIFSDDFVFTIPLYQRAYSWTTEQSEELLHDLRVAMRSDEELELDDLPPYFLGSIVLIKGDEPDAQVIDGQQRLTTLTMLLAALRSLIKSEYVEGLTSFLCEKGNIVTGTPQRYRLKLRARDAQFFRKYIQDEGGIEELKKLIHEPLPESQRNIRDNTLGFIRELQKIPESQLIALTQFIVNRCFLIVVSVSTPDLDSAYKIFSVLNSRGLDLSYSDILKAEIISAIPPEEQEIYTAKWEDLEQLLGSDLFEELFFYLRTIFAKERSRRGLIEEFHQYVYPKQPSTQKPQDFIDNILVRYAYALNYIVKANYQHNKLTQKQTKEINSMFKWLNQIDNGRWIPPALYYFFENWIKPDMVLRFLTDLERLVVSFIVCKIPPYKRIDRYCQLLKAISRKEDLYLPSSPLQLTSRERQEVLRVLDGDIYFLHSVCRYILLRLDAKLSEGIATYDYDTISVEHVLPRHPSPDSEWVKYFPSEEIREKYVHRLGNLVLLSRGKNFIAENYDFEKKKQKYFNTSGITTFALTSQVIRCREWTPLVVEQRQRELMNEIRQLWRL